VLGPGDPWGVSFAVLRAERKPSRVEECLARSRAVAIAEVRGPAAALALVDELPLGEYHLFHAVRADLLRRLGRLRDAAAAYDAAIERSTNAIEGDFLRRSRRALDLD
jgi:RNA polymerase sigma-70 factor (ECF subfamily)